MTKENEIYEVLNDKINTMAIITVLLEKGIMTQEDLEKAKKKATEAFELAFPELFKEG